jgi:hypothetical protein
MASLCRREQRNLLRLGLYVMCLLFLPKFNQIWGFSTDFHNSFQYQIARKSVLLEPRRRLQRDGRTESRTNVTKLTDAFILKVKHTTLAISLGL